MVSLSKQSVTDTARFLENQGIQGATIGMVLGTGFGRFAEKLDVDARISYDRIPHFSASTVADHAGNLVYGHISGKHVIIMQGRIHLYEGYTPSQVMFPVQVMKQLGVNTLVVTNAAGGLNGFFTVGDLMMIDDHMNMMGVSLQTELETDHPILASFYSHRLRALVLSSAQHRRITLRRGILAAMLGPSFETPAEIAMLRQIGADAVTMSTIPEVMMANSLGMQVVGLSCITNKCIGNAGTPVSHEEVMAVVHSAVDRFTSLMTHVLKEMA